MSYRTHIPVFLLADTVWSLESPSYSTLLMVKGSGYLPWRALPVKRRFTFCFFLLLIMMTISQHKEKIVPKQRWVRGFTPPQTDNSINPWIYACSSSCLFFIEMWYVVRIFRRKLTKKKKIDSFTITHQLKYLHITWGFNTRRYESMSAFV